MNLLLLTDALDVADEIRSALPDHGHSVDWSPDPPSQPRHDGWIVDAGMAHDRGLTWMRERRQCGQHTPAIVMSEHKLDTNQSDALRVSPRDVLRKPVRAAAIAARLAAWQRLAHDPGAALVQAGDLQVDLEHLTATRDGLPVGLTAREWELFELLARRAGRVVSRAELESLLTRPDGPPSSNAVEVHLSAIRRKVGRHAIETIRGRGYRLKA